MKNTYPNRCEEVLAHHGVKGMHWGIRRYQNPDGSLTAAGAKRVNKDLRKYALKSKTAKKRNKLEREHRLAMDNLNNIANREASRATGIKPEKIGKYLTSKSEKKRQKAAKYLEVGSKTMREMTSDPDVSKAINDRKKRIKELDSQYKKEAAEFLKDYLGEHGNVELKNPNAIKVDLKTKKVMQQTLSDASNFIINDYAKYYWGVGRDIDD